MQGRRALGGSSAGRAGHDRTLQCSVLFFCWGGRGEVQGFYCSVVKDFGFRVVGFIAGVLSGIEGTLANHMENYGK